MRALIIVIDALGIGAAPDADRFGDGGANTLRTVSAAAAPAGEVQWPALLALGLGNAAATAGEELAACPPARRPLASFGAMAEQSAGKDTITGHWELAGIVTERQFHLFAPSSPSFPPELVARFERESGYRLLGNRAASGTEIIAELGAAHLTGGSVIAYTSADSVFQIAAHEEVCGLDELYRVCTIARTICDDYRVARVIARPFAGEPGGFVRTAGRRDFSLAVPEPSMLDRLMEHNVETIGVGKIGDLFGQSGLIASFPEKGNEACLNRLEQLVAEPVVHDQLIFVNLIDTDMLYGHRRDPTGYYRAVCDIDRKLPEITGALGADDLLIVTADHGCDPGFAGSDHTREYVPLLVYRPGAKGVDLGIRASFADAAATVEQFFGLPPARGTSVFDG